MPPAATHNEYALRGDLMPEPLKNRDHHMKITVVLLQRHVAALDHLAIDIRLRSGVTVPRAHIVDAFIAAALLKPRSLVAEMIQKRMAAGKERAR
jgi:hypothetical protein